MDGNQDISAKLESIEKKLSTLEDANKHMLSFIGKFIEKTKDAYMDMPSIDEPEHEKPAQETLIKLQEEEKVELPTPAEEASHEDDSNTEPKVSEPTTSLEPQEAPQEISEEPKIEEAAKTDTTPSPSMEGSLPTTSEEQPSPQEQQETTTLEHEQGDKANVEKTEESTDSREQPPENAAQEA